MAVRKALVIGALSAVEIGAAGAVDYLAIGPAGIQSASSAWEIGVQADTIHMLGTAGTTGTVEIHGDLQVDGDETVVGETIFQQDATFEGNVTFGNAAGDQVSFVSGVNSDIEFLAQPAGGGSRHVSVRQAGATLGATDLLFQAGQGGVGSNDAGGNVLLIPGAPEGLATDYGSVFFGNSAAGVGSASAYQLIANDGQAIPAGIRWNPVTAQWEYRVDGSGTWNALTSGGGVLPTGTADYQHLRWSGAAWVIEDDLRMPAGDRTLDINVSTGAAHSLTVTAGAAAAGSFAGGSVTVAATASTGTEDAGGVSVYGGAAPGTGFGGAVTIVSGASTAGTSGNVNIDAGIGGETSGEVLIGMGVYGSALNVQIGNHSSGLAVLQVNAQGADSATALGTFTFGNGTQLGNVAFQTTTGQVSTDLPFTETTGTRRIYVRSSSLVRGGTLEITSGAGTMAGELRLYGADGTAGAGGDVYLSAGQNSDSTLGTVFFRRNDGHGTYVDFIPAEGTRIVSSLPFRHVDGGAYQIYLPGTTPVETDGSRFDIVAATGGNSAVAGAGQGGGVGITAGVGGAITGASAAGAGAGGSIDIDAGDGGAEAAAGTGGAGNGGQIQIRAGSGGDTLSAQSGGKGGQFNLSAGDGGDSATGVGGPGADLVLGAGDSGTGGAGSGIAGTVEIHGGEGSGAQPGGDIELRPGTAESEVGGSVIIGSDDNSFLQTYLLFRGESTFPTQAAGPGFRLDTNTGNMQYRNVSSTDWTDFVGGGGVLPIGSVLFQHLRWNGSAWVAEGGTGVTDGITLPSATAAQEIKPDTAAINTIGTTLVVRGGNAGASASGTAKVGGDAGLIAGVGTVATAALPGGAGGQVGVIGGRGGNGTVENAAGAGGEVTIMGGTAGVSNLGGGASGGTVNISGGSGTGTPALGGNVLINGGARAGNVIITGGVQTSAGASGNVELHTTDAQTVGIIAILTGSGFSGDAAGGALVLGTGNGVGNQPGGYFEVTAGGNAESGTGGYLQLAAGSVTGSGAGGSANFYAGNAVTGAGGDVNIGAGSSTGGVAGDVFVNAGSGSAANGVVYLGNDLTSVVQFGGTAATTINLDPASIGTRIVSDAVFGSGANRAIYIESRAGGNGRTLTVQAGASSTGGGGPLFLYGGEASAAGQSGGLARLRGGAATTGTGGAVQVQGSDGAAGYDGGQVTLTAGNAPVNPAGAGGVGGGIIQTAGTGGDGTGANGGAGGSFSLSAGAGGAGGAATGGAGGNFAVQSGNGGQVTTGTAGAAGVIQLYAGTGGTATGAGVNTAGGEVQIGGGAAGAGPSNVAGGSVTISGGGGNGTGAGGSINLAPGDAGTGETGSVVIGDTGHANTYALFLGTADTTPTQNAGPGFRLNAAGNMQFCNVGGGWTNFGSGTSVSAGSEDNQILEWDTGTTTWEAKNDLTLPATVTGSGYDPTIKVADRTSGEGRNLTIRSGISTAAGVAGGTLALYAGGATAGASPTSGGALYAYSGTGGNSTGANTGGTGGYHDIQAGTGGTSAAGVGGTGGTLNLSAGAGGAGATSGGSGGALNLAAGNAHASVGGDAGNVTIRGGHAPNANPGDNAGNVTISGGNSSASIGVTGGAVYLNGGTGDTNGRVYLGENHTQGVWFGGSTATEINFEAHPDSRIINGITFHSEYDHVIQIATSTTNGHWLSIHSGNGSTAAGGTGGAMSIGGGNAGITALGGAFVAGGGNGGVAAVATPGGFGGTATLGGGAGGDGDVGGTLQAGNGGVAYLTGGPAGADTGGGGGFGGVVQITGGQATGTNAGATVFVTGGPGGSGGGNGGDVRLWGGASTGGSSGDITLGDNQTTAVYLGTKTDGLMFTIAGFTLSAVGNSNIDLPQTTGAVPASNPFKIGGTSISLNFTAINANKLVDNQDATGLHYHSGGAGSASMIKTVATGSTFAGGDVAAVIYVAGDGEARAVLSDSNDNTDNRHFAQGIAFAAATAGNPVTIITSGEVSVPATNWDTAPGTADVNKPCYLSTTAGHLTLTPPATSGDWVQRVGFVTQQNVSGTTKINVSLGDPAQRA